MKNIEWLKKEIENMAYTTIKRAYMDDYILISKKGVLELINQLDEPEALSYKWINDNAVVGQYQDGIGYVVPTYKLQDLLVPTLSEMEKVQLSKKTANELNRYKELGYSLKDLLVISGSKQAQEKLARAWLYGYTVEEQKYVIKLDDESYLQRYEIDNKNIVTPFRIVGHLKEVAIKFDNKERAEKVAELVEGKVEELEE